MGDKTPSELKTSFQGASLSKDAQSAIPAKLDIENREIEARNHPETYGGDGSILPGGLLSRYKKLPDELEAKDPKKRKDKEFFSRISRTILEQNRQRLDEFLAYHNTWMNWFAQRLEENQARRADLQSTATALDEAIEYFVEHGFFDLDEEGRFKNNKVEAAVKEWEARTGQVANRRDPSCYLTLLEIMQDIEQREQEMDRHQKQFREGYEHHKTQWEEAQRLRDMLDSDDSIQVEQALEGFARLEDRKKVETVWLLKQEQDGAETAPRVMKISEPKEGTQKHDGFSFDFPPVNASFGRASLGENTISESSHLNNKPVVGSPIIKR